MELHATGIASGAKRQGPGRVPGTMHPSHMCAPGSSGGKRTTALVAQEATRNNYRGRTLGQLKAPLIQQAVKRAAPHSPQTLIDMCRYGSAFHTGKAS